MAKKETVRFAGGDTRREKLVELLKQKSPAIFEREPAPAFATGNLEKLAENIIELLG